MLLVQRRALLQGAASLSLAGCATQGRARSDALGDDDATAVASRIRSGEITALEATEAAIARAERLEPQINVLVTPTYDDARARARGPLSGPFAGVPTLVKDLDDVQGQPTRFGSRAFPADAPRPATAPYVAAMFATGLVSIGKSTTPEFGFTATTEPLATGPTRNPWSLDRSSGGSSGGAAAAVAARVVPVAHASDGGGSIRIPASCCGLFGLKPSRGRLVPNPSTGDPPPIDIAVDGCVSRTVRDTAAWLAATQRRDAGAPLAELPFVMHPLSRRLRIGLAIRDTLGRDPHPEVRAAIEETAKLCQSLGHDVAEVALPFDGEKLSRAFTLYWAVGALQITEQVRAGNPGRPLDQMLEPLTLDMAELARSAPRDALRQAVADLRDVEAQHARLFTQVDVLLTPVLGAPPLRIGEIAPTLPYPVQEERLSRYVAYTPIQNVAGAPAMSVPLSWSSDGLPIGSHFAANVGQEGLLLGLAYELEEARPWRDRKPPVSA